MYGLRLLEVGLHPAPGSQSACVLSPILVSLDVVFSSDHRRINQIGYVSLDTLDISQADCLEDSELSSMLSGACYLLGKRHSTHNSVFRHGETYKIEPQDITSTLHKILMRYDEFGKPRNVFLVGHNIKSDITILREVGCDLTQFPTIKLILDTQEIAREVFDFKCRSLSLKVLMRSVDLERKSMHNAGNDAMGTLKALLLLFHNYFQRETLYLSLYDPLDVESSNAEISDLWLCQLEALQRIARATTAPKMLCKRDTARPIPNPRPDVTYTDSSDDSLLAIFDD